MERVLILYEAGGSTQHDIFIADHINIRRTGSSVDIHFKNGKVEKSTVTYLNMVKTINWISYSNCFVVLRELLDG